MQTFLPYADFVQSVQCLDYRRLGKQRVEASQILKSLAIPDYGWKNHPIVKMWVSYEDALKFYYNCCVIEWISRNYRNTMPLMNIPCVQEIDFPPWIGDDRFHASHRSNLLRKDRDFYSQFGWSEPDNLEYVWFV
jgi:hypothetical protein